MRSPLNSLGRRLGLPALGTAILLGIAASGCGEKSEPAIHPPTTAPPTASVLTTPPATTTPTKPTPTPTAPVPKTTP